MSSIGSTGFDFSVLMPVYYRENPKFLLLAMESIFSSTLVPSEFILVCDGPLTEALDSVINKFLHHPGLLVVRKQSNTGIVVR